MSTLPSSRRPPATLLEFGNAFVAKVGARLMGVVRPHRQASCPSVYDFDAHTFYWRYGSSHYGVMVPDLPEPLRYMSFCSINGLLGAPISDHHMHISPDGKGDTASFVHGTALSTTEEAYRCYSIQREIKAQRAPFAIEFGDEARLWEDAGQYRLRTQRNDLQVDLCLTPTSALTWFVYGPLDKHFSVLTRFAGTITQHGQTTEVAGICTLEHFKALAPSVTRSKFISERLQMPAKFFTYQVINLDADQQILLVFVTFADQPLLTTAYYRHVNGKSMQYDGEIIFEVTQVREPALVTPDGARMQAPQHFTWKVRHQGREVLDLHATVDTPYCFGLGAGYVTSYQWQGNFEGQPWQGRGYMEYIDRRSA